MDTFARVGVVLGVAFSVAGVAGLSCKTNNVEQTQNTFNSNTYISQVVDALGKEFDGPSGSHVLVPANAVASTLSIRIGQIPEGNYPKLPDGITAVSPVFSVEPHGQSFALPVSLTLPGVGLVLHASCATDSEDILSCTWDETPIAGTSGTGKTTVLVPTFSLYAVVKAAKSNPCAGLVANGVCGTGPNSNVVFECKGGEIAGTSVCETGSYCRQNERPDDAGAVVNPPTCAQWELVPVPAASAADGSIWAAAALNGKLYAVMGSGHVFVSTKTLPTASTDWSEDTGYTAAFGATPTAGSVPAYAIAAASGQVWVVGPAGLIMHMDATGTWTKLSSPTTANLHGVTASAASGNLYVWIVGDNGTFMENPSRDGTTFTLGKMGDSTTGMPVTTKTLNYITLCNPFCLAAGASAGLFHSPNGWVADTNSLPAGSATDPVWQVNRLDAVTALAVTSGATGYVLQATIPPNAGGPAVSTSWAPVYSTTAGGLRAMGFRGNVVLAVGANGVAARRDDKGVWKESPTGLPKVNTSNLQNIVAVPEGILAFGGRFVPLAVRYIGP